MRQHGHAALLVCAGYEKALDSMDLFPGGGSDAQLGDIFLSPVRPSCKTFDLIIRHVLETARCASRLALETEYLTDYRPVEEFLISSTEHKSDDVETLAPQIAEDIKERAGALQRPVGVEDEGLALDDDRPRTAPEGGVRFPRGRTDTSPPLHICTRRCWHPPHCAAGGTGIRIRLFM
jgi:hypothetical protein